MRPMAQLERVAAAALAVAVSACAIQPDSGPRDVPDDHQARAAIAPAAEGAEASGTGRIYLLAPEGSAQPLRAVLRDPKGQQELIETLVQGPNEEEFADGLRTQIPVGLEVNGVQFNGGVVEVDVGGEIADLSDQDQQLAVAQIVFTASELSGADSVLIEVDGTSRSWPDGDGDLQSDPLTVYDFVGFAESSQPAYPVTPRPPPPPTSTTTPTNTIPPTTG